MRFQVGVREAVVEMAVRPSCNLPHQSMVRRDRSTHPRGVQIFVPKEETVPPIETINLAQKFSRVDDYWHPRIAAELNDSYVKLVKFKGEFVWHKHDAEDELFLVVKGRMRIELRDGEIRLDEGELAVIPRGVEHRPVAHEEAHVVLLEPKTTLNTGNVHTERTLTELERV